jgi:GTP-binding protein LepA
MSRKPIPRDRIRNFCIVAHIDHGKSTLADRMLEMTGTFTAREMKDQILDSMDIERERGITIKAHAVAMNVKGLDGRPFLFNLIDTPGHVDFSYEVSRSLAACEGAVVLVDAAQGIEAQTVSNLLMAIDNGLEIIPVINKVDLPSAEPDRVAAELTELIGGDPDDVIRCSAKTGLGVEEILHAIEARVPAPSGDAEGPLRALIFDSVYDQFRGVVAVVRVVDGQVSVGDRVNFHAAGKSFEVLEAGKLRINRISAPTLRSGEVGYIIGGVKDLQDVRVGDTVTHDDSDVEPLPGYKALKPMVFAGIFPIDADDFVPLREALAKLTLNDASLMYEPESSTALGSGFRCGFLGPLHNEIVLERLRREYNLDLIATVPNVGYRITPFEGESFEVTNPSEVPDLERRTKVEEPFVRIQIIMPPDAIGAVTKLCQDSRGFHVNLEYLESNRVMLTYELPLSEIITDFYDRLKSSSRGYASLDYEFIGFRQSDLTRLDILLNGEQVDAFCAIVHKDRAFEWGRTLTERLQKLIPKQMFAISIQASIGSRVVARSTVSAMRKNVTAKCYGGDVTRERNLLEKQKEGKRRMKMVGRVNVPQEAFLAILGKND